MVNDHAVTLTNHAFYFFLDRPQEAPTFGTVLQSLLGILLSGTLTNAFQSNDIFYSKIGGSPG